MRILAIDTSSQACSAAIIADGQLHERYQIKPRQHTQLILPMINELSAETKLKPNDMDAIAYGCGPGSFTGLRIAAAICQGLAAGSAKPVVAVSSMQAIAQRAYRELGAKQVAVCLDACMHDVYFASYVLSADNIMQLVNTEELISIANFQPTVTANMTLVGDGWPIVNNARLSNNNTEYAGIINPYYSSARDIAQLAIIAYADGRVVTSEGAVPVYLKDVAYKKQKT